MPTEHRFQGDENAQSRRKCTFRRANSDENAQGVLTLCNFGMADICNTGLVDRPSAPAPTGPEYDDLIIALEQLANRIKHKD